MLIMNWNMMSMKMKLRITLLHSVTARAVLPVGATETATALTRPADFMTTAHRVHGQYPIRDDAKPGTSQPQHIECEPVVNTGCRMDHQPTSSPTAPLLTAD